MKIKFAAFLIVIGTLHLPAQNPNRPVPADVPSYEFVQHDSSAYGYYLTAPFKLGPTATPVPKHAMILDDKGYLFWYKPLFAQILLDFKYHPAQQQFSFINNQNPQDIRYNLMDTDFQLLDSFTTINGVDPDLHEFQISSDQTYLLSGIRDSIIDLSNYVFNFTLGSSQTNVIGFVVQELDENHQLLFQWNSNDYVHPTEAYEFYGYLASDFDYSHGNAIHEDYDGGLLLSFRNTNAIYKINRVSGALEWQLGGKSSSFTFTNDNGFSAQHDVRRLPNGNISLYDNANMADPPKISRAVEYSLDTINWTATKVWEYKYDPGFFCNAMGNHQTTDSRNHLVNYGISYRPQPSFVLTDDNGNLLTELFFQDSFVSYRSFVFDIPALQQVQRPAISCAQEGNSITLSAPPGFDRYAWSTGENSSSITVHETGTYQVWVNHGAGMLGSEPFILNNIDNACGVSGTDAPVSIDNQSIIGYYDLLGRPILQPLKGGMYVVRYANGTAKLQFWKE